MTQFLPPNLLALFAPRDPIPFLPQLEKLPHEKHHNQPYSGIAPFIRHFEVSISNVLHPLKREQRLTASPSSPSVTRTPETPPHRPGQRRATSGWSGR